MSLFPIVRWQVFTSGAHAGRTCGGEMAHILAIMWCLSERTSGSRQLMSRWKIAPLHMFSCLLIIIRVVFLQTKDGKGFHCKNMKKKTIIFQPRYVLQMATHSSVLAWRIPVTGEPGGLLSMGLQSQTHRRDLAAAANMSFRFDKLLSIFPILLYYSDHLNDSTNQ